MKISDVLNKDSILTLAEASGKIQLLDVMLDLAMKSGRIKDRQAAMKEILDRERIMSTGVGMGIAIPHAKTNVVEDSTASLVTLSNPIDFDAIDGKPVNIIFLLLGRENNVGTHLRLLSKISRLLNDENFRTNLLSCTIPDAVLQLIARYDSD